MRRLMPTARSLMIHSGQTAALMGAAVLAMAASPAPAPTTDTAVPYESLPEAPPVTAVVEDAGPVTREIAFQTPILNRVINSAFGLRRLPTEARARMHKGVDIAAPMGTTVFSASEGVVARTGYDAQGYGNFIELRHPNGMSTLYGHLKRVDVARGDRVGEHERIGLVGTTGRSTGPHLHFEVRRNDAQVDPTRVLGRSFDVVVHDG